MFDIDYLLRAAVRDAAMALARALLAAFVHLFRALDLAQHVHGLGWASTLLR